VFSLLLPLNKTSINLPDFSKGTAEVTDSTRQTVSFSGEISGSGPVHGLIYRNSRYLISAYVIIMLIFTSALAIQLFRILRLAAVSRKTRIDRIIVLSHRDIKSPFSFFNLVFMPENIADSEESKEIILHESIHASQYHTLDNLLIEFITALMWFNPLVWMMKKSLHLIHEYLADEGALGTGIDKIRYQALLVNQITEGSLIRFSSGFSKTLIKKRMIMMTKNKKNSMGGIKILVLFPLSAVMFITVGVLNGFFPKEASAKSLKEFSILQNKPLRVSSIGAQQDTARSKEMNIRVVEGKMGNTKSDKVMVRVAEGKKSDPKEVTVIGYGGQKARDSVIYIVDGIRVISIDKIDPDAIESVNVMKDDNLVVIRTKNFAEKKKAENVSPGSVRVRGISNNVIYIIDGKESDSLESVNPNDIESMSVLKDVPGIRKYTTRDVDGVIIITTKKQ